MNLLLSDPAFLSVVSGVSYDPDAANYIAAVETADGQSLEAAVKDAINAFFVGCKADGTWRAIKASCILAGARTLNGALVPLAGTAPTNIGPFVSGDYNRKTGLKGNGSTKRLDANRANNADPQFNFSRCVYASEVDTGSAGRYVSTSNNFIQSATSFITVRANADSSQVISGNINGFLGVSRASAASYSVRSANATTLQTVGSNFYSANTINIFGEGSNISNARLSFYSIGESLNLALLDARVTTLINAFSAAIP